VKIKDRTPIKVLARLRVRERPERSNQDQREHITLLKR